MSDLQDVEIFKPSPIKDEGWNDIDFVGEDELPLRITIDLETMRLQPETDHQFVAKSGHWKDTGLVGWVEYAHTQPVSVPPTPPPTPPPTTKRVFKVTIEEISE